MSTGPLLALHLDPRRPLGLQIEQGVRELIRSSALPAEAELPSTRALAADLGVSRGVVVGAYAQLASEGYIALRRGASPKVAAVARRRDDSSVAFDVPVAGMPFNLRPDHPDFALFPRAQWVAATRNALQRAANTDLAYGEPFGSGVLRLALAPFLERTRGVAAMPEHTGVFSGSSQALHVLASVLRTAGARKVAIEDPGHRWRARPFASAGLQLVPVPVDAGGLRVDLLPADVSAVVVSPDHQFPLGVVLEAERRRALLDWAAAGNRLIVEHDYDGHFRYDRPPAGSLQGLAPEHVAYVGSASALLAPTIRLGWAVLPPRLVVPVANHMFKTVVAGPRLPQLALADLIASGQLDRHLRRARTVYRRRRETMLAALGRALPGAAPGGAPVGLFIPVALPASVDEAELLAAARARGFALDGMNEHCIAPIRHGLVLGFAASSEPTLERAFEELGKLAGSRRRPRHGR
jgi:GntR family transcriptional regulator/MocR family aminotransferase